MRLRGSRNDSRGNIFRCVSLRFSTRTSDARFAFYLNVSRGGFSESGGSAALRVVIVELSLRSRKISKSVRDAREVNEQNLAWNPHKLN